MEIWGDESGNLDFDPKTGSKFFLVCTITHNDPDLVSELLALRQSLDKGGYPLYEGFHATYDQQAVRNAVFALLATRAIQCDATYYSKASVYQRIQNDEDYFYKWAWFYHLNHVLPRIVPAGVDPLIAIATLGIKKKRQLYADALRAVVRQSLRRRAVGQLGRVTQPHCAYWSAASHPCLQAADYYTWALARSIEGGDSRSHDLIRHQVQTLYRLI
jgi:hypothetical protein